MHTLKIVGLNAIALLAFAGGVKAADTYDLHSSILTIPLVQVGTSYYENVTVAVGSVLSLNGKPVSVSHDIYTAATNQLLIPAVAVGTDNYKCVVITVGKVLSFHARSTPKYLATSYELSRSTVWLSSDDLVSDGVKYTKDNPLLVVQTTQVDINGDGVDDLLTYDSYPLDVPTPNPPPSIFINTNGKLVKTPWTGPTVADPHGVKSLVGDFNNDGFPDVFSLVAVDPPNGAFPDLKDTNHLLFGSNNGLQTVHEFSDQPGFWGAGASGDIDNDGDLDIVMFNFHVLENGVKNKILWNDGKGNFTYDDKGIGDITLVDHAELVDVNHDGYLDLVIDHVELNPSRKPSVTVFWGNGTGFDLSRSVSFALKGDQYVADLGFWDIDFDGYEELFVSSNNGAGKYTVELFKSDDKGKSFVNRTADYFTDNVSTKRFDHIRVQDIDQNGMLDIFAPDRKDNIRWEWDGVGFVKK